MTDANINRCQYWQALKITKNYCHYWIHRPWFVQSTKLKHLPFFVQNYGLKHDRCKHWQVSRITENYCHQWIQHLQIVHYAKFRGKWLTSFPVSRSPSPILISRSPFPFLKIALIIVLNKICFYSFRSSCWEIFYKIATSVLHQW